MLGRCADLSVAGVQSENIYLYTLDVYTLCVYIQHMNTDNLTTAEINFVKNMLSGLTDEQIIADQTSKTTKDNMDNANNIMLNMGYVWGWTAGRSKSRALFLNNKTNYTLHRELMSKFESENLMHLLWCPEHMANNEYELKVERNTRRSYIKVASQLVERGLLEGALVVTIKKGEGIAEALIEIRNR